MLKEKNSTLRNIQLLIDVAITALSFALAYMARKYGIFGLPVLPSLSHHLFLLYIIIPVWAVLLYYYKAYDSVRVYSLAYSLLPAFKAVLTGGIVLISVLFIFRAQAISRALILFFLVINVVCLAVGRVLLYSILHYIRKKGRNYRTLLIIGTGNRARAFADTLNAHGEWGLKIEGFIDKDPKRLGTLVCGYRVVGLVSDLRELLTRRQVDEIVFVGPRSWHDSLESIVLLCEEVGIKMRIACDFYPTKLSKIELDSLSEWPLLTISPPPHYGELFVVKRAMDVAISAVILLFFSPLLLAIALAIKLTSPGPVFFKQERVGMNGRRFMVLKFRTMGQDAEKAKHELERFNEMSGPVFKMKKDPRITTVGRFLRKFSLDEFPQFINVLKGDMSIVGPRPPLPDEVTRYDYHQRRRLSVRPGITCLWQVSGRNKIGFSDWVKLDLEYIDRWSLGLDLKIIIMTVPAVLKGTGL